MEMCMRNIILIGFMGAGKTAVGNRLSKKLGYEYIDTDQYIEEKEGMTISNIFAERGEEYFRNLETSVIKELMLRKTPTIFSTGGGMPLRRENAELLKELGYPVLLGTSRKRMIGYALGLEVEEREEGTMATTVMGLMKGASIFRVHHVLGNYRALKMTQAVLKAK